MMFLNIILHISVLDYPDPGDKYRFTKYNTQQLFVHYEEYRTGLGSQDVASRQEDQRAPEQLCH